MYKQGVGNFKYFVGIDSLAKVATRADRVCVLNILGGGSRDVTPVSHAYSGGNVVFGTSPGRGGQSLATPAGDIPVFNAVLEGLEAGHSFNTGIIYLPPAGVRDGVAELVRVNPLLKKIVIITEKVSVRDAREVRAIGQANGIDIFGANSLGVADSWNRVRIGGLGGNDPAESLRKGSIAVHSNSGGFSTTIANYLATAGWGTTTLISSGKDVYIHFAVPEFLFALENDSRSKAAVLYVEPGGYYEEGLAPNKPIVACVVGRWKARLTRAVGHAGALAGSGDDALAKERWFMQMLGVDDLFTPDKPVCSAKGAVVSNIAHIPMALSRVMSLNNIAPDFPPQGDLSLKAWFGNNQGLSLPPELDLPVVGAIAPYRDQIAAWRRQLGAVFPRQTMKNCSGASLLDPATQVASLHGVSMLEAATHPFESNLCLSVLREPNDANGNALANVALAASLLLHGDPILAAADAAREAGNAPNTVLGAAISILGPRRVEGARRTVEALIERFETRVYDAADEKVDTTGIEPAPFFFGSRPDDRAQAMLDALEARGAKSIFLSYLRKLRGHLCADAVLGAIATTLAWGPLRRKRINLGTAVNLPWYFKLYGAMIGASVESAQHGPNRFCGVATGELLHSWTGSELVALALTGDRPAPSAVFAFRVLLGLVLTNGPGTISAQGAKGAVAADGPETPERVQLNKAMAGFLTHSGFAHGGNGFEGMQFLMEQFRDLPLADPSAADHGLDLTAMASRFALDWKNEKAKRKESGDGRLRAIPGINHPVFRGKPVNIDPREAYVRELLHKRSETSVFHDYYHALVQALFDHGATSNVFCVNIDAVIAAWLLTLLWQPYRSGQRSAEDLERAAFTTFLLARMAGGAAEIDDHLNRGRNMDTRTPASSCQFVV